MKILCTWTQRGGLPLLIIEMPRSAVEFFGVVGVALDVPTGRIVQVREQGPDAFLVARSCGVLFDALVLQVQGVAMMDFDRAKGVTIADDFQAKDEPVCRPQGRGRQHQGEESAADVKSDHGAKRGRFIVARASAAGVPAELDTVAYGTPGVTMNNGIVTPPAGQTYAFGQPTSRVQQVFGSGGPRAIQVGARFSF